MSERWPGGIVRSTPVTPTGPLQNGTAPGIWTMEQAAYWTKQGLWPTAGNFLAVEDVFSTYLYTANNTTQTITNGIDLAGNGGLIWFKTRSTGGAGQTHTLVDSARGNNGIFSSLTSAQSALSGGSGTITLNSNGFTINGGVFSAQGNINNGTTATLASWTFRKAPKFFDVVTYTGDGTSNRSIAHSLGVAPGMIAVKKTSSTGAWIVYHRSLALNGSFPNYLVLNSTAAQDGGSSGVWASAPTSTHFSVGSDGNMNANGDTYVAYLFAHDTTSTGIIQCGSYNGNGSINGPDINLGWEPQWCLVKAASTTGDWQIMDNMRGWTTGNDNPLYANLSGQEENGFNYSEPNATGIKYNGGGTNGYYNGSGQTYIYIAIRRGPMRTPTLGTTVFSPNAISSGQPAGTIVTTNFPVDVVINTPRSGDNKEVLTRLTASNTSASSIGLQTNTTDVETNRSPSRGYGWDSNTSLTLGGAYTDFGGNNNIQWNFRRAPGFFDVVCYTTATAFGGTFDHNLGVVPELIIVKQRNGNVGWPVLSPILGPTSALFLNSSTAAFTGATPAYYSTLTSTTVSVGGQNGLSAANGNFVAYLFASCPGVSKVGSYTGNGSSQTINCAFTTGARFVMIKRINSAGDWLVWDSARGIVAANDPYLALNNTNAEVTTNDSVDTDNSGFIVNQVAASNVNVNGATYIFLAVA